MGSTTRGRVRVEDGLKRVRAVVDDVTIADSVSTKMVWEIPYYPTYYFPADAVRMDLLVDSEETKRSPSRGTANVFNVAVGERTIDGSAFVWNDSKIDDLEGYVSFDWASMDTWYEEDEEVFVHARDPFTRIDILPGSRNIRVEVDGVTVADSNSGRFLFETGLPARYYLPREDISFEYLTETETSTACPYKGTARYWSITTSGEVHEDVAWGYDEPLPESRDIAGYVAFYNEKLEIYVDGALESKPKSIFG